MADDRDIVRRREKVTIRPAKGEQDVRKPTTSDDAHKSSLTSDVRKRKNSA
jgi:hypothetical protein